jgi:hypothetical protein
LLPSKAPGSKIHNNNQQVQLKFLIFWADDDFKNLIDRKTVFYCQKFNEFKKVQEMPSISGVASYHKVRSSVLLWLLKRRMWNESKCPQCNSKIVFDESVPIFGHGDQKIPQKNPLRANPPEQPIDQPHPGFEFVVYPGGFHIRLPGNSNLGVLPPIVACLPLFIILLTILSTGAQGGTDVFVILFMFLLLLFFTCIAFFRIASHRWNVNRFWTFLLGHFDDLSLDSQSNNHFPIWLLLF